MARRTYTTVHRCAFSGCTQAFRPEHDTRADADRADRHYRERPWRCPRHSRPDEVIAADNPLRRTVLTVVRRDLAPHRWWHDGSRMVASVVSGPGFRAFAEDFPEGTRLAITAQLLAQGHVYQSDGSRDRDGQDRCAHDGCGLPRLRTDVHDPPIEGQTTRRTEESS